MTKTVILKTVYFQPHRIIIDRGSTDNIKNVTKDTQLTLANLTQFIAAQWINESWCGIKRTSWDSWDYATNSWSNNSMGVTTQNRRLIEKRYGFFDASLSSTALLFESIGLGTLYMGMCLNTVSNAWNNYHNKLNINDLACAAFLYNPNDHYSPLPLMPDYGEYWVLIMKTAFGKDKSHWGRIRYNNNRYNKPEEGINDTTNIGTKGWKFRRQIGAHDIHLIP